MLFTFQKRSYLGSLKSTLCAICSLSQPCNCTAWLQPLDITFNGPFKRILRDLAGGWLVEHVLEQLRQVNHLTKVKLNVRLTHLRPHFCRWGAKAHRIMGEKVGIIMRGWDESGMGLAFKLFSQGKDSAEFKQAQILADAN